MPEEMTQGLIGQGSHPSRVRGLKCLAYINRELAILVAPFTGAWIEIRTWSNPWPMSWPVAPFTGAWIEIADIFDGLAVLADVAPFTGAWIEILFFPVFVDNRH